MQDNSTRKRRYGPKPRPIADRFWANVERTESCWLWTGHLDDHGYGLIYTDRDHRPRMMRTHRVSWEMHVGLIPVGLFVCHICDVRTCVRPDHLFLGTAADNQRDMAQKGRAARGAASGSHTHPERIPRGETQPASKLTDRAVVLIRSQRAAGDSWYTIARAMGISVQTARRAGLGVSWAHVTDGIQPSGQFPFATCKHGHAWDAENTAFDRRGHRVCRACKRRVSKEQYERRLALSGLPRRKVGRPPKLRL